MTAVQTQGGSCDVIKSSRAASDVTPSRSQAFSAAVSEAKNSLWISTWLKFFGILILTRCHKQTQRERQKRKEIKMAERLREAWRPTGMYTEETEGGI